jgi:hypothetical protein
MSASIHKFQPHKERLTLQKAQELKQMLLDLDDVPDRLKGEFVSLLDKRTAAAKGWTFIMLSPSQNALVVKWIAANSGRRIEAMQLWAMCFEHLRNDTGEIMLRREELADRLGISGDDVSRIMSELEGLGAIIRRRERVAGMKGPGVVRYFMNPNVATHLAGVERDKAQADAPLLTLMEGGKA